MFDGATERKLRVDGRRLEIFMAIKGITQKELAEQAGVNQETVVRIKKGGDCNLSTIAKLAAPLGVSPLDLLQAEGFPAPHLAAPAVVA